MQALSHENRKKIVKRGYTNIVLLELTTAQAQAITDAIKRRGMTKAAVARAALLNPAYLNNILSGKPVQQKAVNAVCRFLNLNLEDI